jgi:hypothetical protein
MRLEKKWEKYHALRLELSLRDDEVETLDEVFQLWLEYRRAAVTFEDSALGATLKEYENDLTEEEVKSRAQAAATDPYLTRPELFLRLNRARYKRYLWTSRDHMKHQKDFDVKEVLCDVFMHICDAKGKEMQELIREGLQRLENRMQVKLHENVELDEPTLT